MRKSSTIKYSTPKSQNNLKMIEECLADPMTRLEVMEKVGLSYTTVKDAIQYLIEQGRVHEVGERTRFHEVGPRKSNVYQHIGVDIASRVEPLDDPEEIISEIQRMKYKRWQETFVPQRDWAAAWVPDRKAA